MTNLSLSGFTTLQFAYEDPEGDIAEVDIRLQTSAGDFDGNGQLDLAVGERPFNSPGDKVFVLKQN